MSVFDEGVVDFVSFTKDDKKVMLMITDPPGAIFDSEEEHVKLLQDKVNSYLAYIETGEIYEKFPNAVNLEIEIVIVATYELTGLIGEFYEYLEKLLSKTSIKLSYEKMKPSPSWVTQIKNHVVAGLRFIGLRLD